MNTNEIRTIAEAFHAGKPEDWSPSYTLWLIAVIAFVRFVAENNDAVNPDAVESICNHGVAYIGH